MNITNVNQKLSIQNTKEIEIKNKSVDIATEKKSDVISGNVGISSEGRSVGICRTVVETDVTSFSDALIQDEKQTGNKEALDYMANHMTEQDYAALSEEGCSMEEYEAGRLERALERRKENKEFRKENVDRQVENKEEFREDIEKIAISHEFSDPMTKKAAQKLIDANLPITDANVEAMLSALRLSDVVTRFTEDGMAALMNKELPLTLENIYNSQYSSIKIQAPEAGLWEEISGQAEEILLEGGFAITEENMEKAKWLFDHYLPISEDTMDIYNSLLELRNGVDTDMLLAKMAEAMKQGKAPEQADLNVELYNKIEQAVSDFGAISKEAVDSVVESGEKLNLVHLKHAQNEIAEQNTSAKEAQNTVDAGSAILQETAASDTMTGTAMAEITAYRQLEEIRLKLSIESAHALAGKGIRIDTSELQKIVDGLKELENQYYENLLEEGNAEKTEANISLLKVTTETIANVKTMPAAVLGVTLRVNVTQSMDNFYEAGKELKASYERAGAAYETLMTAPRKDMGDSIQKAFRNVDAILESMDMELTADNQRAVRILGYNRMEINESSIAAVKAYDSQVTSLLKELHPAATVELIKRGINPLDMPMEQLIDEVKQMKEELGVTEEEKYSTYLWKLEKQNGISEEERKSYIGIYRLLNNIEKTDGAAIGSVLDTGKALTMGNLLTAVRTIKHKGVNVEVNDAFGALESLTFTRETITDQIQAGLSGNLSEGEQKHSGNHGLEDTLRQNEMVYQQTILNEILENISPDKLARAVEEHLDAANGLNGLMDMSLEQLKDVLNQTDDDVAMQKDYLKEKVENIRTIIGESGEALEYLEQFNQKVSIENLAVISEYFTGDKNLFKELKKHADNLTENATDSTAGSEAVSYKDSLVQSMEEILDSVEEPKVLKEKFAKLEQTADEILNQEYANQAITIEDIRNLRLLGKGIALAGSMSRQEHYEIPMITGDSITNVSLTIRKGTGEKGKLQISMNSEQYGRIEIKATIKEQAINGVILCESKDGLDKLNHCKQQMVEELKEIGLTVKQLSVALSDKALERLRSSEEATDQTETSMLYKTAKVMISQLRTVEAK